MDNNFDDKFTTWLEGSQKIICDYFAAHLPNLTHSVLTFKQGRRYIKVICTNADNGQGSVHTFIDLTNGDVLKPAGHAAPAKHARGNIFDDSNGLGSMGPHGPAYLR